jgi:putative ABC transport system permease protein
MLLARLSWAYLKRHKLRWALTVAGVALGVAVLVAMRLANRAVLASFHRTVDGIAGRTELQVHAGDLGFPEEVLERVQAVPQVRAAAPVIEAALDTGLPGQGYLLVIGVDMTGDRSLRDYDLESGEEAIIEDPLVFLAQPDSIMVTREFAQRNGLGDRQPHSAGHGARDPVVHRAGHHAVRRPLAGVRRQPGRDGHLRAPVRAGARPEVRPD